MLKESLLDMCLQVNSEIKCQLDKIYPVSRIIIDNIQAFEVEGLEVLNSYENKLWHNINTINSIDKNVLTITLKNETLKNIKIIFKKNLNRDLNIKVICGEGFYCEEEVEWTKLFERKVKWVGSDGIFAINLIGNDSPLCENAETLFNFGDTFVGTVDEVTNKRLQPHLMLNNTFGILKGKVPKDENMEFLIRKDKNKGYTSYIEPQTNCAKEGTFASNLCHENYLDNSQGWLSEYNSEELWLSFDLQKEYLLCEIKIWNYFLNRQEDNYENRGLRKIKVSYSVNGKNWNYVNKNEWISIDKADRNLSVQNSTTIKLEDKARYIKIEGCPIINEGNFGGVSGKEVLFGLRKVRFITKEGQSLIDVKVEASSEFYSKNLNSWYWMQDGVRIDNFIYYLPLLISEDLTKPEGMQFKVDGLTMIKIPLKNNRPDFENIVQKDICLFYKDWVFGAAILTNTVDVNPYSGDGYIYIYGYKTKENDYISYRSMLVARVKPEDFENINEWRFWDGVKWSFNMLDAVPVLDHVSCEMSVTPIYSGSLKGKYAAVFQYDVNSNYVAYSIGDSPVGPFGEPRKVYYCPEQEKNSLVYAYNAKAHLNLSTEEEFLITYNLNTWSNDLNANDASIYHPRWLRLINTTK